MEILFCCVIKVEIVIAQQGQSGLAFRFEFFDDRRTDGDMNETDERSDD